MTWQDDYKALSPLVFSAMGISFLGSTFIVISYACFKQLRNFAFQLVLYLAIADLILAGAALLSLIQGDDQANAEESADTISTLCYVQALLIEYSFLSAVLWVDIIAWAIYSIVMKVGGDVKTQMRRYLAIGFGVPLLISIIPLCFQSYGTFGAGYWCWISFNMSSFAKSIVMTCIGYIIPLYGSIIFIAFTIFRVSRRIRNNSNSGGGGESFITKLRYYPIVLVICWSSITIHTFLFIFSDVSKLQVKLSWMRYLDTTLACSQGLFNALVFGFTKTVREVFREHLCCRNSKIRQEQELTEQKITSDESSSEDLTTANASKIENSTLASKLNVSVQQS